MKRAYEDRTSDDVARVYRRPRSIQTLRRRHDSDSFRFAFHTCAPRTCIQEKGADESEPEGTQAKDQAFGLGPRLPRHGLVNGFRFSQFAGEFGISKALAGDLANHNFEAFRIVHLPIVEAARVNTFETPGNIIY